MFHLRRALISELGYREAFYRGVLLDFRGADGEPASSVLQAINGRGKTTLLSLIFYVFEPASRRFVQTLQSPAKRLEDYVTQRPGFVILELEGQPDRGDLFATRRLLVLGAMLVRGADALRREYFFIDASGARDAVFDGLPIARDPWQKGEEVIADLPGFYAWRKDAEQRYASGFYSTSTIADWQAALREQRVDVTGLARQVDFCRSEGGISEQFSFSSERAFLLEMLRMGLKEERATDVHASVETATERLANVPVQEAAKRELILLTDHLSEFQDTAKQWHTAEHALSQATRHLVSLAAAVVERRTRLDEDHRVAERRFGELRDDLQESESDVERREHEIQGAELLLAERALKDAQANQKANEDRIESIRREEYILVGAHRLWEARKHAAKRDEIDAVIGTHTEGLRPDRDALARLAAAARKVVTAALEGKREELVVIQQERDDLASERAELDREDKVRNDKILNLTRQKATQEAHRARASELREKLEDEALLAPGETSADALVRWQAAAQLAQDEHGRAADEVQRLETTLEELADQENKTAQRISKLEEDQTRDRQEIKDGDAERISLTQRLTAQALTSCDPADDATRDALERLISNNAETRYRCQADEAVLQLDHDWIERTGVRAPPRDVQVVTEALARIVVEGPRPFGAYIAHVEPNADVARGWVTRDPSLAHAVVVYSHSALALARTLDVDVDRPVSVVLAADFEHEPDPQSRLAPPPRTVVHPRHDASHHLAAASDFANGIGERLAALAQRLDTLQGHTRELDALRDDLVAWSRRFPRGRLDDLRRRIDARSRELDMARKDLARTKAQCADTQRERDEAKRRHEDQNRARDSAKGALTRLERDWLPTEQLALKAQELLRDIDADLQAAEADLKRFAKRRAEINDKREGLDAHKDECVERQKNLERDLDAVPASDAEPDPEDLAQPHEVLLERYRTRNDALAARESELGLALLSTERNEAHKNRTKAARQYDDLKLDADANQHAESWCGCGRDAIDDAQARNRDDSDGAQRAAGRLNTQVEQKQADAERAFKQRREPFIAPPWAGDLSLDDMRQRINRANVELADARAATAELKAHRDSKKEERDRIGGERTRWHDLAKRIDDQALEAVEPRPVEPIDDYSSAADKVSELIQSRNHAKRDCDTRLKDARRAFDTLADALNQMREGLNRDVIAAIRGRDMTAMVQDVADLIARVGDRIKSIDNDLASSEEDLNRVCDFLKDWAWEARRVYVRALEHRIPSGVQFFADQHVLRDKGRVKALTRSALDALAKPYFLGYRSLPSPPTDGIQLAADLLLRAVGTLPQRAVRSPPQGDAPGLGISVIRPVSQNGAAGGSYSPVTELKLSGGQGLASAFLLWLVFLRLRSDALTDQTGGARALLILDNPLGKASSRELLSPMLEMAASLNVQLVVCTGIEDLNALSVFPRILKGRITHRAGANGPAIIEYTGGSLDPSVLSRPVQVST